MAKESAMKNKFELRGEREVDIAKTFIGVSPIRNLADERSCYSLWSWRVELLFAENQVWECSESQKS